MTIKLPQTATCFAFWPENLVVMTTLRKLIVEVVEAKNLLPKDGHGTSSPYVVIDFDGQRRRTQTVHRNLHPEWKEVLEFRVDGSADVAAETLEIDVLHDKRVGPSGRNNFLGRVRLNSLHYVRKGEEALMYFPLEKKSFWSWIRGEIGLKIYYVDEDVPPPPPPPPLPEEAGKSEDTPPPAASEPSPEATPAPPAEPAPNAVNPNTPPAAPPDVESNPPENPSPPDAGTSNPTETATPPAEETAVETAEPPEPPPPPPAQESTADAGQSPEEARPGPEAEQEGDPLPPQPIPSETVLKWDPPPEETGYGPKVNMPGFNAAHRVLQRPASDIYARDPTEGGIPSGPSERSSFDLVEKMHYVFVRIVKARSLPSGVNPFVKISVHGSHVRSKTARKTTLFEWDQTFAFGHDAHESTSALEISVWEGDAQSPGYSTGGDNFLGGVCFEVSEIPIRDPPDSPLAPQWYRLEGGGVHNGDLMLATWIGTQADESFADSWKTDTNGNANSRSKVYLSPKLWYLRATILEAQDLSPLAPLKDTSFSVKIQLGFQTLKTRSAVSRNGSPSWNEDLIFVAAEPFRDCQVSFSIENRLGKEIAILGTAGIPLTSIERRVDDRKVASRWFDLESPPTAKGGDGGGYGGRLHVRVCFDGGYHVSDEPAHATSDYRPTARQLWRPPVGMVELGIVGCRNLLPAKAVAGKGTADAYAVAKYGEKWVRTRIVADCLDPKWNEQYTWQVYDPCTVLTVGIFDSADESKDATRPQQDSRFGNVRIRISTLESGKVYKNTYPLLLMLPTGVKKMGEVELAVRLVRAASKFDMLHVYSQPMLPRMHHLKPIGVAQQEALRQATARIVAQHLSRSEPALRREIVLHMLDANSHTFSMRKVRANWFRIVSLMNGAIEVVKWVDDTRAWKNPTATLLAHVLLVLLVWHPDLLLPTVIFYVFALGAWNRRLRPPVLYPHPCTKISQVETVDRDELDEEFDQVPSGRPADIVRARYDRLRILAARVQTVLGDFATHGERIQALVTWRDPRATGIFIASCFVTSLILYVVPSKMVAMVVGFYFLRHPMFRDRMPAPALNFFRRLPSLSDRMM